MPGRRSIFSLCALAFFFLVASCGQGAPVEFYAKNISNLIDPAKLAKLRGDKAVKSRVRKYVAQLSDAKRARRSIDKVAARAVELAGMKGEAAKLTALAMTRKWTNASRLGCFDKEGLAALRKGESPTIRSGFHKGKELSVDHIIPKSVLPELEKVIANLELLPLPLNESKGAKIGEPQINLARKLKAAGMLSDSGLQAVLRKR